MSNIKDNMSNNLFLNKETMEQPIIDTETNIEFDEQNHHPLLSYVKLLAHFIRLNTNYEVEISYFKDEYNDFFQIDEKNNEFYFAFFLDKMEFAIDNFDNFVVLSWKELLSKNNTKILSKLQDLGASETLMNAYQLFLTFLSNKSCYN